MAYVTNDLFSLSGYLLPLVVGFASDVLSDSSFGSCSYMSIDCLGLADSDSSVFVGNSESIISNSVVPNDCLLLVDPIWLIGIVVGVG